MAKIFTGTGIVLAAAFLGAPLPALAQSPESAMLAPGVYTTADISARCQQYAARRVTNSSAGDRMRQSVFIACVRRLARNEGLPGAPVAAAPLITSPVGLAQPPYGYVGGPIYSQCWTDEGYGRIGSCDTSRL